MNNYHKLLILIVSVVLTILDARADYTCTLRYKSHIRSHPGFGSSILTKVPKYTPLKILGEKKDWFQVKGINYQGWIHKKIVDTNMKCIIPQDTKDLECPDKPLHRKQPIVKNEGFKIIFNELGCSKVSDKYGNKLYLFTGNVWPMEHVKALEI